ncbi:uncharacterized protein LOC131601732 [Vicia villosa]|uniref:uncharacterized protein LOC131601732 n=1 Tax=Vicia villosa TaxID=3911 RepID=UPI00273B4D90|nr:uncharacterized protein LOC131601732 [Vicia villosa]
MVAKIVLKKMQTSQNVRITNIIQDLRQNYSVGITVCKAWKEKLIAKKMLEGDADRPNPTIPPRFGCFYFCFEGCKKGFINGCRPFVGVDGCHLKTKYGGQLLIAVGRNPNDQYFPLAFGVVGTETKESWKWFLELLMNDVGQSNRYVFISDQQKGLVVVFEEMFERIEHKICLRHLYANFKKKFGRGALIRDLIMEAAKATYYKGWLQKMNELKLKDPDAWTWLMGVPLNSWCANPDEPLSLTDEEKNVDSRRGKKKLKKKYAPGEFPLLFDTQSADFYKMASRMLCEMQVITITESTVTVRMGMNADTTLPIGRTSLSMPLALAWQLHDLFYV